MDMDKARAIMAQLRPGADLDHNAALLMAAWNKECEETNLKYESPAWEANERLNDRLFKLCHYFEERGYSNMRLAVACGQIPEEECPADATDVIGDLNRENERLRGLLTTVLSTRAVAHIEEDAPGWEARAEQELGHE
jgi:hypothetical protein